MKVKDFFIDVAKGAGIGVAAIIPGVSGGSIAVIFKIYEKMVGAIHSLFKSFIKSVLILLPIVIGIAIGFLAAIIPINYALDHFMLVTVALFAGLLIGSIPDMFKYVKGDKPKWFHIVLCVVGGLIAAGIGVLSVYLKAGGSIDTMFVNRPWYLYPLLIAVGFLAACGFVVPGISGSMLMMITGFYDNIVDLFSNILHGVELGANIAMLGCVAVGIIVGFFVISITMDILLKKFPVATYWVIIGFIIGSVVSLFMNNDVMSYVTAKDPETGYYLIKNAEFVIAPFAAACGFVISFSLIKFANKKTQTKEETNNA